MKQATRCPPRVRMKQANSNDYVNVDYCYGLVNVDYCYGLPEGKKAVGDRNWKRKKKCSFCFGVMN